MENSSGSIGNIRDLEKKNSDSDGSNKQLEKQNAFLKQKLKVYEDKLKTEIEANINLYSNVLLNKESSQDATPGLTDVEKKNFLSEATCTEVLNPVPLKGTIVFCMDTYPETWLLYGLDGRRKRGIGPHQIVPHPLNLILNLHKVELDVQLKQNRRMVDTCKNANRPDEAYLNPRLPVGEICEYQTH